MHQSESYQTRSHLEFSFMCTVVAMLLISTAAAQQTPMKRNVMLDSIAWLPQSIPIPGVWAGDVRFFDYNDDGRLDVLMAGNSRADSGGAMASTSGVYANDSLQGFVNIEANLVQVSTERGMAWGDFENDGDYDIAMQGTLTPGVCSPVSRVYRNVDGSYIDMEAPILDVNGGSTCWVDYNNDGALDLFLCGSLDCGGWFEAKLYKNVNNQLVEQPAPLPGVWGSSVGWADYDRDGDLDVAISGYGWGVQTRLFRNDLMGDSAQSFVEVYSPVEGLYQFNPVNSSALLWFDYDNDGWQDLLLAGGGPGGTLVAKIYHNDREGTFHDIDAALSPVVVCAAAAGDYDNDGFVDIAIAGAQSFYLGTNPTTRIYHNNGEGTFTDIGAQLVGTWFGSVEWGDYDNDGRLDLVVTGACNSFDYQGQEASVLEPVTVLYRNTVLCDSNDAPSTPPESNSIVHGTSVTLTWGGAADAETPDSALSYNVRIGTTPGGIDAMSPLSNPATGFRRVPKAGNVGMRRTATVMNLRPGTYTWSVQAVDNQFRASHFAPERTFTITSSAVDHTPGVPGAFALEQNFPNPFNPKTVVGSQLPVDCEVKLAVYDLLGREVAMLVNEKRAAGSYQDSFSASGLASGVYIYRLTAGAYTESKKMTFVR